MILFFFQAEDGIRDIGVTGVQTCALPISVELIAGRRRWRWVGLGGWRRWRRLKAGSPELAVLGGRARVVALNIVEIGLGHWNQVGAGGVGREQLVRAVGGILAAGVVEVGLEGD